MNLVKRAGTAGLMAAALALCSGAASAAPAMGGPAQTSAIPQDAGPVLLVKDHGGGGGDRWIGGPGGSGGNVGRTGRSSGSSGNWSGGSGGKWNKGSGGKWNNGSASGGGPRQHVGDGDWDRRGHHHRRGHNSGAYFDLDVTGAVLDGALDDEDYGYDEGPSYAGSSAMRRCAARFRSFEWDTGRYTTYGGDRRLCPYLR